jgi:hypothetical protein
LRAKLYKNIILLSKIPSIISKIHSVPGKSKIIDPKICTVCKKWGIIGVKINPELVSMNKIITIRKRKISLELEGVALIILPKLDNW